jgi:apolipoprotein N-acyltransferase
LVRVANNGISGVVDAAGRVLARTGLDAVTYADVALPEAGPPTLYSRAGDWLFLLLLIAGLVPVLVRWRFRGLDQHVSRQPSGEIYHLRLYVAVDRIR